MDGMGLGLGEMPVEVKQAASHPVASVTTVQYGTERTIDCAVCAGRFLAWPDVHGMHGSMPHSAASAHCFAVVIVRPGLAHMNR